MRSHLFLFLLAMSVPAAGEDGAKVEYVGGTLPGLKPGNDLRISAVDTSALAIAGKITSVRVPYSQINQLEYGQKVGRAVLPAVVISPLFLLNKTRKHFLTLGYTDAGGAQQAVVVRIPKGDVRAVLASLEARTGLRVTYQDNDARKM